MTSDTTVTLRGMRFHVAVGILPHEARYPQPLEIDVSVSRGNDRAVLDYRELYAVVSAAAHAPQLRYLEDIAGGIADRALALDGVLRARVAVRKPHVALDGPLDHAEIVIERTR